MIELHVESDINVINIDVNGLDYISRMRNATRCQCHTQPTVDTTPIGKQMPGNRYRTMCRPSKLSRCSGFFLKTATTSCLIFSRYLQKSLEK